MQDLHKELQRVIELNKLMKREVGNRDHLFLQSQLLVQEGITELSEAAYQQDRIKLRDALAGTVEVAMCGFYVAGGDMRQLVSHGESAGEVFHSVTRCVRSVVSEASDWVVASDCLSVIECVMGFSEAEGIDLTEAMKELNNLITQDNEAEAYELTEAVS